MSVIVDDTKHTEKRDLKTSIVWQKVRATGEPFLWLYGLAIFTLLLSFVVTAHTGNSTDLGAISGFAFFLGNAAFLLFAILLIVKFAHMVLVERPESPSRALGRWLIHQATKNSRAYNLLHSLIVICLFVNGFSDLKGAIAILHPFSWDETLLHWDQAVHFGALPHEWLRTVIDNAQAVTVINFFYNAWYFIMLGSLFVAGVNMSVNRTHRHYLASILLIWLIGGFFLALFFSSAGPCYYERAGFGDTYSDLMTSLHAANVAGHVWALPTQDMLWDGYAGLRDGSAGISAFPSIHVASSVAIALYVTSLSRAWGIVAWVYALIIQLGSVVLAWHYAVDGYAGALVAIGIWWAVGRYWKLDFPEREARERN